MKKTHILDKLKQLDILKEDIKMGDFDVIGEYTARKNRKVY